jgi:lipopolysaccharide heptosyltransferase III
MAGEKNRLQIKKGAVLAIQLGDIGDVVLTLPSLHALKTAFPGNILVACVREKARELIEICPDVDAVLTVHKKDRTPVEAIRYQRDFFKTLRSFPYDLSIDFRTGTRGAIISLLAGAKEKMGFYDAEGRLWRNRIFSDLAHIDYRPGTYVADYYFELVKRIGISPEGLEPALPIPQRLKQTATDLLKTRGVDGKSPFLVLQPFSLWRYKELHPDKYVTMIDRIGSRYRIPIVLCGAPNEKQRAKDIADRSQGNVINMAGATSIGELAGLLSLANFFIGVDSAGLHIAAATGIPTASIFGPSAPSSWAPRGNRHTVIQGKLPCVPCRQKGCDDSGVSRCLDELTVNDIVGALVPTLDRVFHYRAAV